MQKKTIYKKYSRPEREREYKKEWGDPIKQP